MKIVGYISDKKVLAEIDISDLSGLMALTEYEIREKSSIKDCMSYGSFKANIVGQKINVASIYADAKTALDLHKGAKTAADQLKRSASKFLGFFAD